MIQHYDNVIYYVLSIIIILNIYCLILYKLINNKYLFKTICFNNIIVYY